MGNKFEIRKLDNCKIDMSYVARYWDGATPPQIVVNVVDGDSVRDKYLTSHLTVISNDGYVFDDVSNIGEFEISLDGVNHLINFKDFEVNEGQFDLIEDSFDFALDNFYLQDKDLSKTLYLKIDDYILGYMGGFDKYKNVVMLFEKRQRFQDTNLTWNTLPYSIKYFKEEKRNEIGSLLDEYDIINYVSFESVLDKDKPIPPATDELYKTYYMTNKELEEIKRTGKLTKEMIINCYLCPIKFDDRDIIEVPIKVDGTPINVKTHKFLKEVAGVEICKFNISKLENIEEIVLKIPFINEIVLKNCFNYGKIISVEVLYEVCSNSCSLKIFLDDKLLQIEKVDLLTNVPFKPSLKFDSYSMMSGRLCYSVPSIQVKCKKISSIKSFVKGSVVPPKNILKTELEILNNYLANGIYFN